MDAPPHPKATALSSPRSVQHRGKKIIKSCNNLRAESRLIVEGNRSPQCLAPHVPSRAGAVSHPWAVIPAGHASRCCHAPANVGKADPNTEPHAANTICLPSPRCQRRRQPGSRQHTGRASHTAWSENFSGRILAGQHSVSGGAGRALSSPWVTRVGHPHSTALAVLVSTGQVMVAPGWIFQQAPPKEVSPTSTSCPSCTLPLQRKNGTNPGCDSPHCAINATAKIIPVLKIAGFALESPL